MRIYGHRYWIGTQPVRPRDASFSAANANSFLEDFYFQRFVSENALQLTDSFFQSLHFGNTDDLVIAFIDVFPPSPIGATPYARTTREIDCPGAMLAST